MKLLIASALLVFSYAAIADSFDDNLKELFTLTGAKNDYISLNNVIINQMQVGFFQAADQNINDGSLDEDQKKQVGELLKNRFTEMVKKYQEHINKSMPYEKVEKEIYLPLYKETYTESEVKELIVFYKTPVGKKSIEATQKISQQITEKSAEKYDSIIVEFVKGQIKENIEIVQKEMSEKGIQ